MNCPRNIRSRERMVQGTNGPGNESSRERMVPRTKVPSWERMFQGTNSLGNEYSSILLPTHPGPINHTRGCSFFASQAHSVYHSVQGLFTPRYFRSSERPGTKVPGNFRSRERKFHGTFVPWSECSREHSFRRAIYRGVNSTSNYEH